MKRMLWPQTLAVPRVTGAQGSPARVACAYRELWPLSLQPHDRPRRGRLFTAFLKVFAQHTGIVLCGSRGVHPAAGFPSRSRNSLLVGWAIPCAQR